MDLKDPEQFGQLEWIAFLGLGLLGRTKECETIAVGAVNEGPNVTIAGSSLRVGRGGRVGVPLRCSAALDIPCAGTLAIRVVESRKEHLPQATSYTVAPGASSTVTVHLSAHDRAIMRRRRHAAGAVVSVEKGHFGDKTTLRMIALRAWLHGQTFGLEE